MCERKIVLFTERLYLAEMNFNDINSLKLILKDDETMYAYEGAFNDREVFEWLNKQILRYEKYGFGLWAVFLKENNEFIGQCGLTMQQWKNEEVLEIGYLFNKKYWHKGYAIEAASACKEYAFNVLNVNEVCSIIRDTNIPSQNVAIRNGMVRVDESVKYFKGVEMPHFRYVIKKKNY